MIIYPSIDIFSGKCVRLFKGSFQKISFYEDNPVKMAKIFLESNAKYIHIVDLNRAKNGNLNNLNIILDIYKETNLNIQLGGGIRNEEQIKYFLDNGIKRIVIGSLVVKNPILVKKLIEEYGNEKIVLALDVCIENNIPYIVYNGWQKTSKSCLWEFLSIFEKYGVKHILCTDIQKDGTLEGSNLDLYKLSIKNFPNFLYQASGGVSSVEEIIKLKQIGLSAVIIGKAFYENKLNIKEVINQVYL
jgi:phosphoribosylformimino-5-aminoimidazole carboxamide ribotide isomerase